MSLHEAARASGLNHTTLSRIESGERPINPEDLRRLANIYEVPWEALVMAQRGQLPMALAGARGLLRDRGNLREERFQRRVTIEEKRKLDLYLDFLRFEQRLEGSVK